MRYTQAKAGHLSLNPGPRVSNEGSKLVGFPGNIDFVGLATADFCTLLTTN
jgi:hypothetical protein